MPAAQYARLTRYAAFAVVHLLLSVAAIAAGGDGLRLVALVAALPFLFAWGHFQADVTLNPELDEPARTRWRNALWCLPWSIALYWQAHVRPRRVA